jgi:hypothetical protein
MARAMTAAGRALTVNKYRVSWRGSGSLFDRLRMMLAGIEEAEHGITECGSGSDGDVKWKMRQTLREHSSVQRRGRGESPASVSMGM